MDRMTRFYLVLLGVLVLGWFAVRADAIRGIDARYDLATLAAVTVLYGASHLFRVLRLALLSLNRRDKAFALASAHALTAFPSSFLPFKTGELLRLGALSRVVGHRRSAFALWLAERFCDITVISVFILGLYLSDVTVPPAMRTIFALFLIAGSAGLFTLFAVSKTFVYLNRHLVLISHSRHGLQLLRASHALRQLELEILRCVDGRITAVLLLTMLIWALEVAALALFVRLTDGASDFAAMIASGLFASLPGRAIGGFGLFQSLALVALTLLFLGAMLLALRMKPTRT
jgi:hypothetical protein